MSAILITLALIAAGAFSAAAPRARRSPGWCCPRRWWRHAFAPGGDRGARGDGPRDPGRHTRRGSDGDAARPCARVRHARAARGVVSIVWALQAAELHHRSEAILDPLTGLLNRHALAPRFVEISMQARLTRQPVCLLLCDVDNFKAINDQHGHDCGDAVLRDVAYALRKHLRSFELVYRLGGEEFLVVLPGHRRRRADARLPSDCARRWSRRARWAARDDLARPERRLGRAGRLRRPLQGGRPGAL